MFIRTTLLFCVLLIAATIQSTELQAQQPVTIAGQDVSLRLGSTIQPRFTYVNEDTNTQDIDRIGFGVRRFRLRTYIGVGSHVQVFSQLEGSGTNAQLLDLRVDYKLNSDLTLRVGRFAGAQPRAMAMTLHSDIDAIDRAASADYWARNTLGADARDYGAEIVWKPNRLEYRLFLHNGDNRYNYRSGAVDESPGLNNSSKKMAVSSMIRFFPNNDTHTDIGIYGSYNGGGGQNPFAAKNYYSAAFHAYRGTFPGHYPLRVKFDAILTSFNDVPIQGGLENRLFAGATIFTGYLVRTDTEVFGRLERFSTNAHSDQNQNTDFATIGLTYSFSAAQGKNFQSNKVTAAYTWKNNHITEIIASIFQIQVQVFL